eukprot:TRINITY_DN19674_c0_g1_i3.p1 TRINITY_DN19674_c0_g1~~TRINITY_DN19674_c0_g1_i3.p1  ORF type:complete len:367 (+),score=136.60 TRINITY_DN19674_c0_g1_i3:113-1102(+)
MSFTIEAGSDLYGTKHNILLSFGSAPTLFEFVRHVEAQFDIKARASRPAGYPDVPFKVETLQIFGDQGCWVDLVRDDQLRPGAQVWIFQPESIWHSDAQGVIPKAEQPAQWAPRAGSPQRQRQATDAECPPTLVEKMTAVFHEIDGQGKGYLLREDIERAFNRAEIQFNSHHGLFAQADLNRSQHITWDEWQQFAIKNSSVLDALFFKLKDAPVYTAPPPLSYVSRQPGYPGSPVPYNPPAGGTYSRPAGYQSPPQGGGYAASSAPAYGSGGYGQPGPSYGQPHGHSPQRDRALQDYEMARQKADAARMQKEQAEKEEREAWDRLYKTP